MDMLRERIKGLERRIIEMIRAGHDNEALVHKMHRWTRAVMLARSASVLPQVLIEELKHEFMVPMAALRVWGVATAHAGLPWAQPVSEDLKTFTASLAGPFCGLNSGFEAANWLPEPQAAMSIALIPLRADAESPAFGLLVLASPDAQRFNAEMGTDFLERIAELASGALSRLRP